VPLEEELIKKKWLNCSGKENLNVFLGTKASIVGIFASLKVLRELIELSGVETCKPQWKRIQNSGY
jgi:hypothetical protein